MRSFVYAVRDIKSNAFMQPFVMPNDATAIRAFGDAVMKGDNPMSQHSEDYELYRIAAWEDETGLLTARKEGPKQLALAANFVKGVH